MKSILLVEDDPFLIDVYATKLRKENFEIEVAKTGKEALKKLEKQKFSIVILDIVLPNIDGWTILRKMKKNPALKDLKVIVLSNLGQKEEVEKGLKLGADRYLIKAHFTPGQVVEKIKKTLK